MASFHQEFSLSIYFLCKNCCYGITETPERTGNKAKKNHDKKWEAVYEHKKKVKRNHGEKGEEMKMKQGDEVTASEGKRGENADIK